MGVSENKGYLFGGSLEEGSYYLGYYVRAPCFRKLPYLGEYMISGYLDSWGWDPG